MWGQVHNSYKQFESNRHQLMSQNSIFSYLRENQTISLFHVTNSYEDIIEQKSIYPSSGCLVGSIYCTPIFKEGEQMRLHNLGSYYWLKEAPNVLSYRSKSKQQEENFTTKSASTKNKTRGLIIEVDMKEKGRTNLQGINYLKLGNIHYNVFQKLQHLLTQNERLAIEESMLYRLKGAYDFLAANMELLSKRVEEWDVESYFKLFKDSIKALPIMGYTYFEALSHYIMLYQNDDITELHKSKKELYNWHYKDLLFYLYPEFWGQFELGKFNPDINMIINYIKKNKIIKEFDSNEFLKNLVEIIVDLVFSNFLYDVKDSKDICISDNRLPKGLIPLAGHTLHREIKNCRRYSDLSFYFDQLKAFEVWNYWNEKNIVIPFNGVIPKGEMGINPAFVDNIHYKIFECEGFYEKDGFFYLKKGQPLDIHIIPRLVDINYSFMRSNNNSRYE